ncbi:hypothetical protein [Paractinoplanes globisporus]|uniref:Uncharacterized protein n=1 Tax=Paractinoplanes globisporus TaxID=113565 RepID=A0ABW6W4B4_9ACTN|nr:hypothetical protein [Actinoplanes globisporus]
MSGKAAPQAGPDDGARAEPVQPGPGTSAPVGSRAMAGMSAADVVQVASALPAVGNFALSRLLGGPSAPSDPLADPRFNPESLVDRLARAIDSDEVKVVSLPQVDLMTGTTTPGKFVRHVDAAAVAAVLDDLTAAQAEHVARLYETTEGRPLEKDLFGTGHSGFPSDLTDDATKRIQALMRGTRQERKPGAGPPPALDAKIEADASELHQLLSRDLTDQTRERVMTLHRRDTGEIDRLDSAYARLFGGELSMVLGGKLTGLQRSRMAFLRDGDRAKADACAIEDKRRAIEEIDKRLRPFGFDARYLPNFGPVDMSELSKKRAALVADIQAIAGTNVAEAQEDPGGLNAAEAVRRRLGAVLGTLGSGGVKSLGEELEATLGAGAGQAITALAHGDAVAAAARKLLELEITHTTSTDAIAPLLRGLRAQAYRDVQAMIFDGRVAASEKERIGRDPEGAADGLAKRNVQAFIATYDSIRDQGGGRSWESIVDSASSGNEAMLRGLVAGGGGATELQELEFALSRNDKEGVLAVLGRQPSGRQVKLLEDAYDAAHGIPGGLRMRLFGPFGVEYASGAAKSSMMPGGMLFGRDAARAAEALSMPVAMGGQQEMEWLATGGSGEVSATEATSGLTGTMREWGDVPETQQQMRNSAGRLRAMRGEFGGDPWAVDRPGILSRARRVRATLSGDAAAYEEENEALRDKIRQGVSFAVTVALGLALPGLGYGFAATMALNIGGTVITNLSVYGEKYSLSNFRADVLGGLLGGLGGAMAEEVVGAVAARVVQRSAGSAAGVIEREGIAVALAVEAPAAQVTAREAGLLETVSRWGAGAVGQSAGTSVATGHNEFSWSSFGTNFGLSALGHWVHSPRPGTGPEAGPRETEAGPATTAGTEPGPAVTPRTEPGPTVTPRTEPGPAVTPRTEPGPAVTPRTEPTTGVREPTVREPAVGEHAAQDATGPVAGGERELVGAGAGAGRPGEAAGTPQGGMRGTGVLPLAEKPVIGAAELVDMRLLLVQEAEVGGLRHGTTFEPTAVPAESMRVAVGLDAAGGLVYSSVQLDIALATPAAGGVHGLASGHAANRLTFDGTTWRARIEIDPRLQPRDAQLALRHETNEVAGIVAKVHERGLSGTELNEAIAAEQRSGLTREGARGDAATEHDIATTVDLIELFQRYRADPSEGNRGTLDRQLQAMGFAARSFGQELVAPTAASGEMRPVTSLEMTRDRLIRDHAPKGLHEPLLSYIDQWRLTNTEQTPFVPADRPAVGARIREYTDALVGRAAAAEPFARLTPEQRMDAIEILAQTGLGAEQITAKALIENGMDATLAADIVATLGGQNPYRNLYAELESMMTLRRRLRSAAEKGQSPELDVGFGFVRQLRSVEVMTGGGPLDMQPFGTVWERLQAARDAGYLEPATKGGDPMRPQFVAGSDPDVGVRLTWHVRGRPGVEGVDSLFVIDLPGKKRDRGFRSADLMGAHFEPAKPEGGAAGEHVSETGVVVPADSAPSHIVITPDRVFMEWLDRWGLRRQRVRLEDEFNSLTR